MYAMKLYLGSYRIADPSRLESLLGKPLEGLNVAIVGNAKDLQSKEKRTASIRDIQKDLGRFGMTTIEIDLRDIHSASQVKVSLEGFDMVFPAGGNSYILRQRMQESHFDEAIIELLEGDLAYCGESAGSVVAGKILASADVEDIKCVEEPISEGLGLIDRIIIPHANWKKRQGYIEESLTRYGDTVLLLGDYDAYVVSQ
jgi:peptidase E